MAKRLRCYLGLHRYERRRTEEGKWYEECRSCGKFVTTAAVDALNMDALEQARGEEHRQRERVREMRERR
jgi:hypothetical protein